MQITRKNEVLNLYHTWIQAKEERSLANERMSSAVKEVSIMEDINAKKVRKIFTVLEKSKAGIDELSEILGIAEELCNK